MDVRRGHRRAAVSRRAGLERAARHQDRFVAKTDRHRRDDRVRHGHRQARRALRRAPRPAEDHRSYYQETGRAGRDGTRADAWMSYGLADVVNNRRLIDESEAGEGSNGCSAASSTRCSRSPRRTTAGARGCCVLRRGERPVRRRARQCDNCASPPATWDATDAARKALSCIYRFAQHAAARAAFGAVHLIDVLRGKTTDKVSQFGHERLSTFGIGADLSEAQWRAVLRQLVARGSLAVEGEYQTLALAGDAKAVLKGEVTLELASLPRRRNEAASSNPRPRPQRSRRPSTPRRSAATPH